MHKRYQAGFPVLLMCRVLDGSPSGFYAWSNRAPCDRAQADTTLAERIVTIHQRSRGTYGAPRIHAELRTDGVCISEKRVSRLMRKRSWQEPLGARSSRPRFGIATPDRRLTWSNGILRPLLLTSRGLLISPTCRRSSGISS